MAKNLSALLIILPFFLLARNEGRFNRISIDDGLSLSSVYCIFQDSKGFMWFGTEDGLNRYDGKNFTIFRPQKKSVGLTYKWIENIYEDSKSNLWLSSRKGLTKLHLPSLKFTQYYSKNGLACDTIIQVFEDSKLNVWAATTLGLSKYDSEKDCFTKIIISENKSEIRINKISENGDGTLFLATNNGLYILQESGIFNNVELNKNIEINDLSFCGKEIWLGSNSGLYSYNFIEKKLNDEKFFSSEVLKLLCDKNSKIWIINETGLFSFDTKINNLNKEFESEDLNHSLSIDASKPFFLDKDENLWYGTFGSGLIRINTKSDKPDRFLHDPTNQKSISENSINCIYQDNSGTMWFGTFGAGISSYNDEFNKFSLLKHQALDENSLSENFVWSICELKNGTVWIGTNNSGIDIYNPKIGKFSNFSMNDGLAANSIREIFEDSNGRIWIGTDGGGLDLFNPKTKQYQNFSSKSDDKTSISSNSVRVVFEDSKGNIWIGTRNGLNKFLPQTNSFKRFLPEPNNPNSLSNGFIYSSMAEDKNGHIWIGTYGGGLNKFNSETETFISYQHNHGDANSIADDIVFGIFIDGEKLWLGTNSGLNLFDPENETFQFFGTDHNLPNEVIYSVLPDENNNIWLSTNLGVCCFNLEDYSTTNYSSSDGLQSNEFNGGAFFKGKSGTIYFGGVYGLNFFNPQKINTGSNNLNIAFTSIKIAGNDIKIAANEYLKKNVFGKTKNENQEYYYSKFDFPYIKKISLDYSDRFFSIDFVALNSVNPKATEYSYTMIGLDEKWENSGTRNYVSYHNLPAGDYSFLVKAKNGSKEWSKPTEMKIQILPPFWQENWFLFLIIISALLILSFIYQYLVKIRTNKILYQQYEQIQNVNDTLRKSEKELTELNQTKDKFFSIISHDLKNPFTSLMSLSNLVSENFSQLEEDEKKQSIDRINKSLVSTYRLLENLLTWSRSQRGHIPINKVKFSMDNLIQENFNLFKPIAAEKQISLDCDCEKNLHPFADRDMVNTIVRNLLNNSIKFTNPNGSVILSVKEIENKIEISVSDNGVGIPHEKLKNLFFIDRKCKTKGTIGESGTGLGLIICKEFLEKNNSELRVESTEGEGSRFSFSIEKSEA